MIHDQALSMVLWEEACNTAIYVQNRSTYRLLGDKSPEVVSGVKPETNHLRIFDCLVYIHVPMEKRKKLEPSGQKGIFVGYKETSKAYRIFIPT
jgi:hypothetical protein